MKFLKFYKQNSLKDTILFIITMDVGFLLGGTQLFGYLRDAAIIDKTVHFPLLIVIFFTILFTIGGLIGSFAGSFVKYKNL